MLRLSPDLEEFPKSLRERGAAGHEALKLENEFFAARDNAVSTLKINISLAIRNASMHFKITV